MRYITTNHRFIIDDKHPADVFDEMENFFSLYTVAIDDLQQVSVQLSIPPSFALQDNKKLAEGYRQLTKALKYTIPDIHILPVTTRQAAAVEDNRADEDDHELDDDNSVILLIQRLDGYVVDDEDVEDEAADQRIGFLGKLLPRFIGKKSPTGLYPQRENISLPTPAAPVQTPPVALPVAPVPPVPPVSEPVSQPQPQQPHATPTPYPVPQAVPPVSAPSRRVEPMLTRLPNIAKSAAPYQALLTHAIVKEAQNQVSRLKGQRITQITLKSRDSLTTAMIEQLFFSFSHAHDPTQTAHDALDLVSYGHEVLKSQLHQLGLTLAEDAQFGLKTNHNATPADITRLQRGEVFANEIKLGVKLIVEPITQPVITEPGINEPGPGQAHASHGAQAAEVANVANVATFTTITYPNLNQNAQRIALVINVQDSLGERQQKIRQFPVVFVPAEQPSQANHIRMFGVTTGNPVLFSMVELDGNVFVDAIDPALAMTRNGQAVTQATTLLPNDILTLAHGQARVQLLLPTT